MLVVLQPTLKPVLQQIRLFRVFQNEDNSVQILSCENKLMRQKLIFKSHLASLCIRDLGQLEKGLMQESR